MVGVASLLRRSRSHPTGVRGLKFADLVLAVAGDASHPTGVRGLKFVDPHAFRLDDRSHPTGVRGLKLMDELLKHLQN